MATKKIKRLSFLLAGIVALNAEAATPQNNNADPKPEFVYSSIQNPDLFQQRLADDAAQALDRCLALIGNNEFTGENLGKILVEYLPQSKDPKIHSSEDLVRSCVRNCLEKYLTQYVKDPTLSKWDGYLAKTTVEQVMEKLLGKPEKTSEPDEILPKGVRTRISQKFLGETAPITNGFKISRPEYAPVQNVKTSKLDMKAIVDEKVKELLQNTHIDLAAMSQKTHDANNKGLADVNELEKAGLAAAKQAADEQQARQEKLEEELKAQAEKAEADKKAKEAEKVAVADDAVKSRISDFLMSHTDAEDRIKELQSEKRNSAYIAARLMKEYPKLAESARLNEKEPSSKIRDHIKAVLDELYSK